MTKSDLIVALASLPDNAEILMVCGDMETLTPTVVRVYDKDAGSKEFATIEPENPEEFKTFRD